jgi:hypothetical protein
MQPGATEVLNGVKQIIFNVLFPELHTEQARQQAMYSSLLIDHVIARWEAEPQLLVEERTELRALLGQALTVIGETHDLAPLLREALEASANPPVGPRAMADQNEAMRRLVPDLARALPDESDERTLELDGAIRAYIRNQHRRDQAIVAIGEVAW